MPKEEILGIDLGTTNSAVSIMEGGQAEIITNAEGQRITPSVVAFTEENERVVGQVAKRQAITNPGRTIQSIKRKMGTDFEVKINQDGEERTYTPEQISAMIVKKLKKDAQEKLGGPIDKAVITVPAYFNDSQRQAAKDAGKIAGFEVDRIVNEPTAASMAYGLEEKEEQTILVYDLGGGTFDVSILEIGEGVFEVVSTDGDTQLGGDDFDQKILDWLVKEFRRDTGLDLSQDLSAMQRLRDGAESAKKELSSKKETTIHLPYISADKSDPKHLEKKITRSKFEGMINGLLERTLHIMDNALTEAKVSPEDVDQVVLVGGSTRIPKVKELMEGRIPGKINKGINPDEVVAVGAAIQGGVLAGEVEDIVLLDVTPLTLSIETLGGVATPLIEKNTTIPTEKTKTFSTASDNQTTVDIHVVQGERNMAQGNKSLGRFQLTGIPPAPRGVPKIDVSFSIDADGILSVTAEDKGTKKSESITLREPTRLTDEEIERMKKEAEEHEAEDKEKMEEIETRNEADQLIYSVNKSLQELGDQVSESKRKQIKDKVADLQQLVDKEAAPSEIRQVMEELSEASHQLAQQAYKQASEAGEKSQGTDQRGDEDQYVDAEYEEDEE